LIDPKYTDQQLDNLVAFKGTGQTVRVAVVQREKVTEANNAGADVVGSEAD